MSGSEGIFTQPGPNGIFGGDGGPPGDASSPAIDSGDQMLRETLLVAFPSPGHMRVARAVRNAKTGGVEMQEQYRVPTAEEMEILKREGVPNIGPGSLVPNADANLGAVQLAPPNVPMSNQIGVAQEPSGIGKVVKIGAVLAGVAAVGFLGYKYVWPMLSDGDGPRENGGGDDDDDDADED